MAKKLPKFLTKDEFEQLYKAASQKLASSKSENLKKKIKSYMIAMVLGFEGGLRISEVLGLPKALSPCCKQHVTKLKRGAENGSTRFLYLCDGCGDSLKVTEENIPSLARSTTEYDILPLSQSDIEGNMIRIRGAKGGKDRVTYRPKRLTPKAIGMLPLSIERRSYQRWIGHLGMKTIGKLVTPHWLRHGFGTHLVTVRKLPLPLVQQLMGHSRMDTTAIYVHVNPVEAIDEIGDIF